MLLDQEMEANDSKHNYKKGDLRKMSLKSDSEVILKYQRVAVRALDFDWIFDEDNCKNLLELLVKDGAKRLFK